MREILFRGKRMDNGEWVEGAFLNDRNGAFYICPAVSDITYGDNGNRRRIGCWYNVDHDTVCQYTGLTDKNGKRIFEGDIVSTDVARPYLIVEFRDGCFMFNCNDGGEDYYDIMLPILKEAQTEYKYGEVIGNIHDNPELLKGGNEE